jgi:hypothetical protein
MVDLKEIECKILGWINLDLHREKWQAVVDMAMNPLGSKIEGNLLNRKRCSVDCSVILYIRHS